MRILIKLLFVGCIVSLLVGTPASVSAQPRLKTDKELGALIDKMLTDALQSTAAGATVIVVRNGQTILRKGYGMANLELGVPAAPEQVFRLGSVTKQFTAAAILMLADEGKLTLNDDITKFLPNFPTHGQKITIENLLTHTGGIKNYTDLPEWFTLWRKDMTLAELINLFKDKPLDFVPGTQWSYSNSGYVLLGAIIEKAAGMSYEAFIEQRIFAPLGMTHSYYDHTDQIIPGRVVGYSRGANGVINAPYLSMTQPYAAGSLAASVDDLARWDAALYTAKLLKSATLQRAFKPYLLKNGQSSGYGYGWVIANYEGHSIVQHNGGINGFATQVMRLPDDKVYVAILTNLDNNPVPLGDLAFQIAALVIDKPYQEPTAITLPATTLDDYAGVYQVDAQTDLIIRRDGDQLVAQYGGGSGQAITPSSPTDFFIQGAYIRIKFVKNAAGDVTEVQVQDHFGPWRRAPKTNKSLPAAPKAVQLDPAIYQKYVGEYQLAPTFSLVISVEDGKLIVQPSGQDKAELFPTSETKFFLTVVDAQIEFEKDASGTVTGLVLHQNGQALPGKKVK